MNALEYSSMRSYEMVSFSFQSSNLAVAFDKSELLALHLHKYKFECPKIIELRKKKR